MPILDITELDFADHAPGQATALRRAATVRNGDARAVLHVGVKSPVPWLELYPTEFALAPQGAQTLTVEMRPERARDQTLAPAQIALFGQYIAVDAAEAEQLPPDVEARITVLPPVATCPKGRGNVGAAASASGCVPSAARPTPGSPVSAAAARRISCGQKPTGAWPLAAMRAMPWR